MQEDQGRNAAIHRLKFFVMLDISNMERSTAHTAHICPHGKETVDFFIRDGARDSMGLGSEVSNKAPRFEASKFHQAHCRR